MADRARVNLCWRKTSLEVHHGFEHRRDHRAGVIFREGWRMRDLEHVAKKLKAEGFEAGLIERHFDGLTIWTQITDLCKKARADGVSD